LCSIANTISTSKATERKKRWLSFPQKEGGSGLAGEWHEECVSGN